LTSAPADRSIHQIQPGSTATPLTPARYCF
jgi:hypothetical protein